EENQADAPANHNAQVVTEQHGHGDGCDPEAVEDQAERCRLLVRVGSCGHLRRHRFASFPLVPFFFATNSESSPLWKKIIPCSSLPFTTAQPRPCAGSISSLRLLRHVLAPF